MTSATPPPKCVMPTTSSLLRGRFTASTIDQVLNTQDFLNNEKVQLSQQQDSTVGVT